MLYLKGQKPSQSLHWLLEIMIIPAVQALAYFCQRYWTYVLYLIVLNCGSVWEFDMLQLKCELSCTFTVSLMKNLFKNLTDWYLSL